MIYFTELQNLPFYGVRGEFLGELKDVCVDPSQKAARVSSYLVRSRQRGLRCITYTQVQSISVRAGQTNVPRDEVRCYAPDEGLIRIKKDVLTSRLLTSTTAKWSA